MHRLATQFSGHRPDWGWGELENRTTEVDTDLGERERQETHLCYD